jgi:hypothetical protein
MNLWQTNYATVWKRIRVHHVMAAAGVALAVSTVVVMAGQETHRPVLRGPEGRNISAPNMGAVPSVRQDIHVVYFVVSTPAQAFVIKTAAYELQQDRQDWRTYYAVLSADTPVSRVAAEHLTSGDVEALGGPDAITVFDLR